MKPEAKANDWIAHSQTGSRVICREATFCDPSWGNDPMNKDTKITFVPRTCVENAMISAVS